MGIVWSLYKLMYAYMAVRNLMIESGCGGGKLFKNFGASRKKCGGNTVKCGRNTVKYGRNTVKYGRNTGTRVYADRGGRGEQIFSSLTSTFQPLGKWAFSAATENDVVSGSAVAT